MSLLNFARSVVHERRAVISLPSSFEFVSDNGGASSMFEDRQAGDVSVRRAAGYPPVSQVLQMLAGDLAKMPAMAYQVTNDGRHALRNHNVLRLVGLFGHPNDTDTTFDMFFNWFFHGLLYGRSAIWINRIGAEAYELLPLLPDRTYPVYFQGKRYFQTELRGEGQPIVEYIPDQDVLYLQYLTLDGLHPEHPVRLYRDTFRQAISAQDFTSKFFENGSQQGGILMVPPGASEPAIRNVELQIKSRADKENWFRTLVLKDGFKWQSTTFSLRDSTAVELDEATARQMARLYNVPPSKVGLKDTVSYNSLDQDNRQYLDSCLSSWLIQARSQFHRKLLLPSEQSAKEPIIVDYEIDALQWADPSSKASVGMLGLQNDFLEVNTVRSWFNERPLSPEELKQRAKERSLMQQQANGGQNANG